LSSPLERFRVLHVTPAFFPATYWGGPIFSVFALCESLARTRRIDLEVLTTDTAGPHLRQRLSLAENPRHFSAGFRVTYCRRILGTSISAELLGRVISMVRHADLVHLTGTYSFPTIPTLMAARYYRRPVVWSPRGALQRWAGSRRKSLKRAWEHLCNAAAGVPLVLHVTSEMEAQESAGKIGKAAIRNIPNGVDVPLSLPTRNWKPDGTLRLLYIGRLDKKKGIENLIEALTRLPGTSNALTICGTGDLHYTASLHALARLHRLEQRVRFIGQVEDLAKQNAFLTADVCVVPSFSENFGNVVAEALAHGVPVIASQGTPWSAVEQRGCGWWVPNDPQSLARAIQYADHADLELMGRKGREWMLSDLSWDTIAAQMLDVYEELVASPDARSVVRILR
jgi:glycosyltransferase involved in cell wall biosynthesis